MKTPQVLLECDYCHTKITVKPDQPDTATENWLVVLFNGEQHEFCSPSDGSQWLKNKSNVISLPFDEVVTP